MRPRSWHFWIGLFLGLALIPILRELHLPFRFDWITFSIAYWFVLVAQSIFLAAILCLIGLPIRDVFAPLYESYRRNPLHIVLLLLYFSTLVWAFSWTKALVMSVDTIAVLEFRERRSLNELGHAAGWFYCPPFIFLPAF